MDIRIWWIWLIMAALFLVGEIFTSGFFLLWFGIGAAIAGILALLGVNPVWQWGLFAVISGVLVAISRKFAEKFTQKQPPGIGADRFIGKKGVVLEPIDNNKNTGRVRLDKEEWRASSVSGEAIPLGEMVVVTKLDGTHLVVRKVEEKKK
jgi:membrane protein implicated in regulation of membrane protease activity